jgi:acyl-CoA oxidase
MQRMLAVAADPEGAARRALTAALFTEYEESDHERWRLFIAEPAFRYRPGLSDEQQMERSYARLRALRDTIESAETFPASPYRLCGMFEWAVVADGAFATVAAIHYNLFLGSLVDHDADTQRDLSDFTEMRRIGTFLCTELSHGNNVSALETTATFDPTTDEVVLHSSSLGARKYMPNTSLIGGPKTAVVAARLLVGEQDHGVFLFLVPLSDESGFLPGIEVKMLPERMGNPVDHSITSFHHVRVPRHAMLQGEHGRLTADGAFTSAIAKPRQRFLYSIKRVTLGKLTLSSGIVGASRASLAIAVRYAHHREVSGLGPGSRVPVASLRSHHAPLIRALATAYAMTFLHRAVLREWLTIGDADPDGAERLVAMTKAWLSWEARWIFSECRERCGAQALFPINRLANYLTNVEGVITAEGDNLPILVKAAAQRMSGSQPVAVDESAVPTAERKLTDLPFLRDLLLHAEHIWQTRSHEAMRTTASADPLDTLNAAVVPALAAVRAHTQWRAAVEFLDVMERTTDSVARSLLHRLCQLFLLGQLKEHSGDLLADGHLTAEHVRQLPATIDTLIAELAPFMMTLVDAFDLPTEVLADIPIANEDYLAYLDPTTAPPEVADLAAAI